jgi:hypothetical protein
MRRPRKPTPPIVEAIDVLRLLRRPGRPLRHRHALRQYLARTPLGCSSYGVGERHALARRCAPLSACAPTSRFGASGASGASGAVSEAPAHKAPHKRRGGERRGQDGTGDVPADDNAGTVGARPPLAGLRLRACLPRRGACALVCWRVESSPTRPPSRSCSRSARSRA